MWFDAPLVAVWQERHQTYSFPSLVRESGTDAAGPSRTPANGFGVRVRARSAASTKDRPQWILYHPYFKNYENGILKVFEQCVAIDNHSASKS